WPGMSFSEVEETIGYAEENGAYAVTLNLPGFTRYFPSPVPDWQGYWDRCVDFAIIMRQRYAIPVRLSPRYYEEYVQGIDEDLCCVQGVVKNSPAHVAGVLVGDRIRKVGDIDIEYSESGHNLLRCCEIAEICNLPLEVERGQKRLVLKLPTVQFKYPYKRRLRGAPYGIMLTTGVSNRYIREIAQIAHERRASRVLLLSSKLLAPFYRRICDQMRGEIPEGLEIVVPENRFFGGNIIL
ncbi:MAG: hypothetical protein H5U03_08385, partial [Clostridia bacterium]|nr:hypothetical protein [Clostridia bacterium]